MYWPYSWPWFRSKNGAQKNTPAEAGVFDGDTRCLKLDVTPESGLAVGAEQAGVNAAALDVFEAGVVSFRSLNIVNQDFLFQVLYTLEI